MSERLSESGSTGSAQQQSRETNRSQRRESMASDNLSNVHRRRMSRLSVVGGSRLDVFRRLSVVSGDHSVHSGAVKETKKPNTYRLGPEDNEKFNRSTAERIMSDTLESYLDGESYDRHRCVGFAKSLSEVIKAKVKDSMSPKIYTSGISTRYKIVCHVFLGQDTGQSMQCASRCLLNANMDGFASASYSKGDIFAIAAVYALYTD